MSSQSTNTKGRSPAKKVRKTEPKAKAELQPLPYPKKVDLDPPTPQQRDCAFNQLKREFRELPAGLINLGVAFDIDTPHIKSFKTQGMAMVNFPHMPCSYLVQPKPKEDNKSDGVVQIVKIDKKKGKMGSTSDAKRRWGEYNSMGEWDSFVVNRWDAYDEETLNYIDEYINKCYLTLSTDKRFTAVGGFWEWIKTKSIDECREREREAGGLSIFLMLWMELTLNHNGKKKYGVGKNLHIRIIEMANQLHYDITKGAQFEQLHYDIWGNFIIPNHEIVKKSTNELMARLRRELGLSTEENPSFKLKSVSVSWEPGLGFNTKQALTRYLTAVFGDEVIKGMSLEVIGQFLDNQKVVANVDNDVADYEGINLDSSILENVDPQRFPVDDVIELVEVIYDSPDDNGEKELMYSATELIYDVLLGEKNSKSRGKWINPYKDRPDSDDSYNASNLDHETARAKHKETIKDLKSAVDDCEEDGKVLVAFMDRMKTAYTGKHENSLQESIQTQGFTVISTFGDYVTAYVYKSTTRKCLGLLLVHHAFSKALTSRAPYRSQGPVRGRDAVKDNSNAAVACLYIHAIMMTVRGETTNFEPNINMIGNPVTAYAMVRYCLERWHLWDSRVAVMFGKSILASDTTLLGPKYGLEQKHRNQCQNDTTYYSISKKEKIMNLMSGARDNNDNMRKAIDLLKERVDGADSNDTILRNLSRLKDVLHEDEVLYKRLRDYIQSDMDEREKQSKEDVKQRNEAAETIKAEMKDKETGDEEKVTEDIQKAATKPGKKKR